MGVQVEYSQVINRSVDEVFRFMVDDHVRNHPRWDSDIELWMETDDPIQLGTIIQRRNTRSGEPVEGTMEVIEFERDRAFATLIHDGPTRIIGRIEFKPMDEEHTRVRMIIDFPDMEEPMDTSFIERRLEETGKIRRQLIETEV